MALVGETRLLRDPRQGLVTVPQQSLGTLKPTSHDVASRTDAKRQLERSAEVVRAEACHGGEIG